MNRINLPCAKLSINRYNFRFEGYQHIADATLKENSSCVASTLGKNRNVFIKLGDEVLGLLSGTALLENVSPCRKVGHAAIATCLGVHQNHLDPRFDQIGPVPDVLGISVSNQEEHCRRRRCCAMWKALRPISSNNPPASKKLNVCGGVHCDDVSF